MHGAIGNTGHALETLAGRGLRASHYLGNSVKFVEICTGVQGMIWKGSEMSSEGGKVPQSIWGRFIILPSDLLTRGDVQFVTLSKQV